VSCTYEELCQRAVLQVYKDELKFIDRPTNWWDSKGHRSI